MSEADDSPSHEAAGPAPPRAPSSSLFDRLRGLFGITAPSVRDDIEDAIDESAGADFTPQERAILKNVLALHDVRLAEIMAPRADVISVHVEAPLREVLSLFRTAGHSRLPVYGETLDDPRGMVHIRDFLDFLAADPRFEDSERGPQPGGIRRVTGHRPTGDRIAFRSNKAGNRLEALELDRGLSPEKVNNIDSGLFHAHLQSSAFSTDCLSRLPPPV